MLYMKKLSRFGVKAICVLIVGGILYTIHLQKLTKKVFKKEEAVSESKAHVYQEPPEVLLRHRVDVLPHRVDVLPHIVDVLPRRVDVLPHRDDVLPHREDVLPHRDDVLPHRDDVLPHREDILPHRENVPPSTLSDNTFTKRDMLDEYGNPFTIVLWMRHYGEPGYVANPEECMGNISCKIIYEGGDTSSAHAFVYKADHIYNDLLPTTRKPHQLYAWWTLESPLNSPVAPSYMDSVFNLTFHYRTDADVYAPYGSINLILRELKKAGEFDIKSLLEKKRGSGKMAAWAVSNCYNRRMQYARSLMEAGLKVDTYGGCFNGRQIGRGRYSSSFYDELSKYKFYFSFENSIACKDYFTEKFWFNGLRSGAVPIVWGPSKEDLLKVAPTKSFIHANDYSSPKKLVKYLEYLAGNETAYAEYLQWRTWVNHPEKIEERLKMKNRDNDLRSFCKLCSIIQADARRRRLGLERVERIYPSINKAWQGPENGKCHN